jgi:indole-3-glycerol phosphate synthase
VHPVVDGILKATEAHLRSLPEYTPPFRMENRRDLLKSAESLKKRGITPIIAEIKPRILGRALEPAEVASIADQYTKMGACGISVLTEPTYFMGSIDSVKIARESSPLPVLRKDFILDERQISETEADLVLLIATFTESLNEMVDLVFRAGMEPLVEVHTEEELAYALGTDARIIGINNRNLKTLEVDLSTFERLGPVAKSSGAFVVAESGAHSRKDVERMVDAGADALLVGTSLMEDPKRLMELDGMGTTEARM